MPDTRSVLRTALRDALHTMGVGDEVPLVVEPSARPEFGDWSTPVAMSCARTLRRNPREIAEQLAAALNDTHVDMVETWTATAGYVNARLNASAWGQRVIESAMRLQESSSLEMPDGFEVVAGKTLVEHTATNPNKAAHVGHLRNACIGDVVSRVLRRTGHEVEVENYIDDTGVQVADVAVGIRELRIEPREGEPFDQFCSRVYVEVTRRAADDPSLQERRREVLHAIEAGDPDVAAYVKDIARRVVACHLATMRRFDIDYDLLTWESDIIALGFWRQAFELLRESGSIVFAERGKHAGCWVLPAETAEHDLDSDETKVLVKSDGVATYTAKDIAYQLWKFGLLGRDFAYVRWDSKDPHSPMSTTTKGGERGARFGRAQRVINVVDARQSYPQQVVQRVLHRLGHEEESQRSIHLAYEVVALTPAAAAVLGVPLEEGREIYAFSGRLGIEVRADDLLDRAVERLSEKARDQATAQVVAAGAVRYYLLKFSLTQIIAFDFDEALRTTGDSGVYLQYAHARASGILRKVADDGGAPEVPAQLLPVERALLHRVDAYRYALAEAAESLAPAVLTSYAFSLATALSDFYEHTPPIVREEDVAVRRFRRALVAATRATLADALRTLGMAAPEQV